MEKAHRALYRTYRSRSFDEVVGQKHVTDLLKTAVKKNRIAHAYLLTGPRGVGKTSIARIFAHEINDIDYSESPNLDIIEIDAASNRRIDDIRDLREKVNMAPIATKYKVYIIDEVHMLTNESFNALLKTLEEPPKHVVFILATTELHKLPATITSRTQRYHLRPAGIEDTCKHLKEIAKKESIDIDDDALSLIAQHADGSFRDALSILDQISSHNQRIDEETVQAMLGIAPSNAILSLINAVREHDPAMILQTISDLELLGVTPAAIAEQMSRSMLSTLADNPVYAPLIAALLDVSRSSNPQLKLITTLVAATHDASKDKVVATRSTSHTTFTISSPVAVKPRQKMKAERSVAPVAKRSTPAASEPKQSEAGEFDWEKIISTLKKHHPALHSVVARAEETYDKNNNDLTLKLAYAIHRKKLENNVSKKLLLSVINDTCNLKPFINITDKKSEAAIMDNEHKDIADIMGGGELVNERI